MRDGVTYSYGSPDTHSNTGAWIVMPGGDLFGDYHVSGSYGQSYIIRVRFTARIISVLYMKGAIKYEIY